MPIFISSIILQVALVVHIVKTGRSTTWIWIVVMLPLAGSIAYLIVEVLPGVFGGRAAHQARKNRRGAIDQNKAISSVAQDSSVTDTVENSLKLAEKCMGKGFYEEAKKLYQKSLKGIYEYDPEIMYGLAEAEFGLRNYSKAKQLLDELIVKNPDYKNADAHLLYARTAEELNDTDLALKEYEVLNDYFPGPEATYRYALLLKSNGEFKKAKILLEKILHQSKISGKHYNTLYKEWVSLAKSEYRKY
ncbi:MAG: tetratricopeptide repeat protein [Gammaproteobacteria bacterium]